MIITVILTFTAACFVYVANTMYPIKNDKFNQFPLVIGDWKGSDVPMSPWVYQGLETPYVFLRNYSSPSQRRQVNLSLVWFDDTNFAFHAPEECMSSMIKSRVLKKVHIGNAGVHEVVQMTVEIDDQAYLLLYFFDVDGYITTRQSMIRISALKRRLQFKRASATFIRLMAPILNDQEEALQTLLSFLDVMYPILPEYTYTDDIRTSQWKWKEQEAF